MFTPLYCTFGWAALGGALTVAPALLGACVGLGWAVEGEGGAGAGAQAAASDTLAVARRSRKAARRLTLYML
jgi:hypothetical protein